MTEGPPSSQPLHPALLLQLDRLGLSMQRPPAPQQWQPLLEQLSSSYASVDEERSITARTQEMVSREMAALYEQLAQERDLLESRVTERTGALADSEERFRALTRLGSDWYWEQDADFRFVSVIAHRGEFALTRTELSGLRRWEIQGIVPIGFDWETHRALLARHEPFFNLVYRHPLPDGQEQYVSISGEPIFDAQGEFTGYRGVARDVTREKQAEERVFRLAHYDPLTGLLNRTMLSTRFEEALSRARRQARALAVMFIDLDGFKQVNDTLGHAVGDRLLVEIARRLRETVRGEDAIARLGGDEFLVLVDECDDGCASEVAQRLLAVLSQPVELQGQRFPLSASIGISVFPGDGDTAETLLQHADLAMYRIKAEGGRNIAYFSPELQRSALERMQLAGRLRSALDEAQFRLHWQPKVDARSGEITGVEALLRWQDPERGLLLPGAFVSQAEETGLIVPIGRWTIEAVCRQGRQWLDAGRAVKVSVNLSSRQFHDLDLVPHLQATLEASGLPPALLELELAEDLLLQNVEGAAERLAQLKALGVGIALDDFGAGHSSLAWLHRLPIDAIKIDRSFISTLPNTVADAELTGAMIALGHGLRRVMIAEGVETEGQASLLRTLGCDELQGFLIQQPVTPEVLEGFLDSRKLAPPARIERATLPLGGGCSIH